MIALFLVFGFYLEAGRLHVVNNNRIIVAANHRTIHARITEDVELIEIIQVLRRGKTADDNQLVDYPYNPQTFGHSNRDYLGLLRRRDGGKVILMARLYYLSGKLVGVEVTEQDR